MGVTGVGRRARSFTKSNCSVKLRSRRQRPGTLRDWKNLPPEIVTQILSNVGAIDLLLNAQLVCSSWFNVCKDPSIWRSLELIKPLIRGSDARIDRICKLAVDRSCGYLESISIEKFGNDDLLLYIAQRSPNLRRLRLLSCSKLTSWGFRQVAKRLRLLEDVEITRCEFNPDCFGWFCPRLTSFKFNYASIRQYCICCGPTNHLNGCTIGSTMPGLRHLQLLGFRRLSRKGLLAILEGCIHLQSLDLRDVPDQYLRWQTFGDRVRDPYVEMRPEEYSEFEMKAEEYEDIPNISELEKRCLEIQPEESDLKAEEYEDIPNISELEKRCLEIQPEESELEMRCAGELKEFWSWKETTADSTNCLRQISPKEFSSWLVEVEHPFKDFSYQRYDEDDDDNDGDCFIGLDEYDFYISYCTRKIKQLDFCIP